MENWPRVSKHQGCCKRRRAGEGLKETAHFLRLPGEQPQASEEFALRATSLASSQASSVACMQRPSPFRNGAFGVPTVAQRVTDLSIHEVAGSIPSLTQWVKDPALPQAAESMEEAAWIQHCQGCGVGWQLQL